ncbi:MAG TPA: rod shape-determining protein MreC [Phycisphaerae bacterium]|jgi:cell shape-determining protein MreC
MRFRHRRKFTKRSLFALLLGTSCIMLLLPRSLTGRLLHLVQLGTPLAARTSQAIDAASDALHGAEAPVAAAEYQSLATRLAALQNQLAAKSARVTQLEAENRELTGIRERGLQHRGRLIPARTIASDPLDWREARWVTQGARRGVREGQAVTSANLSVALGTGEGARDGLAVLASEHLLGIVQQAGAHTSRIRLLSDPATRMRVAIGRRAQDGLRLVPGSFWMTGAGRGKLHVRDVDRRYVDDGKIKIGDVVLSPPDDAALPAALTIGEVTEIHADRDNGLLRVLEVTPPIELSSVRQVYIVDPEG